MTIVIDLEYFLYVDSYYFQSFKMKLDIIYIRVEYEIKICFRFELIDKYLDSMSDMMYITKLFHFDTITRSLYLSLSESVPFQLPSSSAMDEPSSTTILESITFFSLHTRRVKRSVTSSVRTFNSINTLSGLKWFFRSLHFNHHNFVSDWYYISM